MMQIFLVGVGTGEEKADVFWLAFPRQTFARHNFWWNSADLQRIARACTQPLGQPPYCRADSLDGSDAPEPQPCSPSDLWFTGSPSSTILRWRCIWGPDLISDGLCLRRGNKGLLPLKDVEPQMEESASAYCSHVNAFLMSGFTRSTC